MKSYPFSISPVAPADSQPATDPAAQLVLFFGPRQVLADRACFSRLRARFPAAIIAGCSGGGQIYERGVNDSDITGLALTFEQSRVRLLRQAVSGSENSRLYGQNIGRALTAPDLAGVIIFADGLQVNGTELAQGLAETLRPGLPVAGGLAADDDRFQLTLVSANCSPTTGLVAAIGLYGEALRIHAGAGGGWSHFGPRRLITRSAHNVLHTLDDRPAIELYERYLGDEAAALPLAGLRFPLLVKDPTESGRELIRTLLGVDRQTGAVTFAGNVPQGWTAQLMRSSFDRLSGGATLAAERAHGSDGLSADAALVVSCIGRRLVLGQRCEDEIETISDTLGCKTALTGFYSYGEFSPWRDTGRCELLNQSMTLLTMTELAA